MGIAGGNAPHGSFIEPLVVPISATPDNDTFDVGRFALWRTGLARTCFSVPAPTCLQG